jgi:Flp pilus assembly protein CpaB
MRPLHLLVIASVFGALVVLAVAMILASPALIPAPGQPSCR